MKSIFGKKNYKEMDWNELVAEAKKQKINPRLYSIKGIEGAGERDHIEIIRQLNNLDQNNLSWHQTWLGVLSLIIIGGIVGGIITGLFLYFMRIN